MGGDGLLYFNGINGATGRYGLEPMTGAELEQRLRGSEKADNWREVDPWDVADNWTANNDARGYLILGDPAARLAAAAPGEEARERPPIETTSVVSPPAVSAAAMARA